MTMPKLDSMSETAKNIFTFRIRPETLARLQAIVQEQATGLHPRMTQEAKPTVSLLVSDLLDAYTERRLVYLAEPIPHTPNEGTDPFCPVLVTGGHHASGNHHEEQE